MADLWRFAVSVITLALISSADAAVTAWTNPVISTASGSGTATPNVAEDKVPGEIGVTIAATAAGTKTYAISSQPASGKISIGASDGKLSLVAAKSFDFETEPKYVLVITCADAGDSTTGTATVTLNIVNANEAPTFAISQYSTMIKDGATAGTSLITVSASDVDASDTFTYSITNGNTGSLFKIDSAKGSITVDTGKTIDQKTAGGYMLEVSATDAGSKKGTTTVWIVVASCPSGAASLVAGGLTVLVALSTLLH